LYSGSGGGSGAFVEIYSVRILIIDLDD